MRVRVGAATDIGRVREGNEDSYLLMDPLYAVADGMGGHRGGEVASNLALQTVERLFSVREGSLTEQVESANRAVFERSQADREVSGMGTTLTAALVQERHVRLAHVGDSRAYLLRDGALHLLTEDHTLVHRMVQEGEISEAEAETHPHRSVLTRALGVDGAVQVDEAVVDVRPGDRVLLCTDGLTGMVTEDEIRATLLEMHDLQEAVERLVAMANRAGGIDNITAVLLDFSEGESEAQTESRAAIPHQPTAPHPLPAAERTDVTVVGRPILAPPPRDRSRARIVRRVGVGTGITLGIVILGVVLVRLYVDSQWFVGVSNGRVAIFRGVPAEVAGFDLNSVVVETSIPAEEVESLAVYRDRLPEGITADDREGADEIVEQIRSDVADARAAGP
jgi:protein phosphatase